MKNSPSSLYIHIPFCEKICDYCDFTKLQYFRIFAEKYIKALKEEIKSYKISDTIKTIYIGGGTPTALDDDLFEEVLKEIEPYTHSVIEYTVEANPESLTNNKLMIMKKYGVNRISIGVESTNDKILKAINRNHSFEQVKEVMANARNFGFSNINLDLILGLPNVTKEMLKKDLLNIISLNPEHISCYSLTIHPHTQFYTKGYHEADSDVEREYYDMVNKILEENGYIHYEISNWAKEQKESKHNYVYWMNEQYYGLGLGASGYIGNIRYTNTNNLDKYLAKYYIDYKEEVSIEDQKEYQIMLNLRTIKGLDLKKFKEKFNEDLLQTKKDEINNLLNNKYIFIKDNNIVCTYEGMMILDSVVFSLI